MLHPLTRMPKRSAVPATQEPSSFPRRAPTPTARLAVRLAPFQAPRIISSLLLACAGLGSVCLAPTPEVRAVAPDTRSAHAPSSVPGKEGTPVIPSQETGAVFSDVPAGNWFAPFVRRDTEAGILSGYRDAAGRPTGRFGPAEPVTYGALAKVALMAAGMVIGDVQAGRLGQENPGLAPYVELAVSLRLTRYPPGLDAARPASRAAAVETILEASRVSLDAPSGTTPFADLPLSHPAARAVTTAVRLGLLTGVTDPASGRRLIRPDAPITRAELAAIVSRFLDRIR